MAPLVMSDGIWKCRAGFGEGAADLFAQVGGHFVEREHGGFEA